ncbi:hypothetical protein DDE83_001755 [Stemphylium lycopersici]|uniref:Ubiquitin-like protease family profile domain-containing protein n=1 Tax=Stemphylium lycopersici TaxID=183478 RepID=A0A364NCI7_STELY|nr:hypothetical protein DDE83_001755 [Stemphylium lycopersici]
MAPTTFWSTASAGIANCYNAKSTCWPGRTRSVVIALLASSALFAIAQLGLTASMAHQLLGTGNEVNCWIINDSVDFGLNDSGSVPRASQPVLRTEVKSLPLTFVNLDRMAHNNGYRVEAADGSFGPTFLRVDTPSQWGGRFITVLCLVIDPLLLVLSLLWFLRCHTFHTSFPISNQALDTFPKSSIRKEDDVCWQSDQAMRGLEKWGTWARGIVVSNAVLGILGTFCMIAYSIVAITAAFMNRQNDEPQSIALDDLNGYSTNPGSNTDAVLNNESNFPSTRLGSHTTAASNIAGAFGPPPSSPSETSTGDPGPPPMAAIDDAHMEEWLNTFLIQFQNMDDITCEIRVREFLEITNTDTDTFHEARWLEDGSIDVTLALLTINYQRPDVYVVKGHIGLDLFHLGKGACTIEELGKEQKIASTIRDNKKRWIIVPVNDGALQGYDRAKAFKENFEKQKKNQQQQDATEAEHEDGEILGRPTSEKKQEYGTNVEETVAGDAIVENTSEANIPGTSDPMDEGGPEDLGEDTRRLGIVGTGSHWGLLVVDKKEKKARWIDSHLQLVNSERYPGRKKIKHMFTAGYVAGIILCGIEQILGPERGNFDVKTAKYVPHDAKDNSSRGDPGAACGPYMIAFLEYLYKNPSYMARLHSAFNIGNWGKHCTALGFNSLHTRVRMQKIIQDASEQLLEPEECPLRMTPNVFRILRPKVLAPLLATAWRTHDGRPDGQNFDDFHFGTDGVGGPRGRENGGPGGHDGGGGGGGGDSGEKDDGEDDTGGPREYRRHSFDDLEEYILDDPKISRTERLSQPLENYPDIQKSALDATAVAVAAAASPYGILAKKRELKFLEGFSKDNLPNFGKIPNSQISAWDKLYESDLFNGPDGINYYTEKAVLHRTFKGTFKDEPEDVLLAYTSDSHAFSREKRNVFSGTAQIAQRLDQVYVNLVVPVFASLSNTEVNNWVKNLHPEAKKLVKEDDKEIRYDIARGMLYRFFEGEFEDMSDTEVDEWRKNDRNMPKHHGHSTETARWWLEWYHYRGDATKTLPYLRESPLHWPNFEHRAKRASKRKRPDDDDDDDEKDESDSSNGNKKQKHSDLPEGGYEVTRQVGPPEEEDPKSISWATVNHSTLMKYVTDEIRNDPRIGSRHSSCTYRAILFVKHGGHFKNEAVNATIWIRDLNVFTMSYSEAPGPDGPDDPDVFIQKGGNIKCRVTEEVMMDRLEEKYEKIGKAPPTKVDGLELTCGPIPPTNPPLPAKHRNLASGYKEDGTKQSTRIINSTALAADPVDFTHMSSKSVDEWVKVKPEAVKIPPNTKVWGKKAILQKIFGGFDVLTDDDKAHWLKNDKHFKSKKHSARDLVAILKERTKKVPNLDCSGVLMYYPQSYLKGILKRPSMTVESEDAPRQDHEDIFASSNSDEHPGKDFSEEDSDACNPSPEGATAPVVPESGTVPPAPGTTSQSSATSTINKNNNKRKHPEPTPESEPKKSKLSRPDFLTMPKTSLLMWVNALPKIPKDRLRKDPLTLAKPGLARIWLERIYNDTFQNWAAEEPLSQESLKAINQWRLRAADPEGIWDALYKNEAADLKKLLHDKLYPLKEVDENKVEVPLELPDYRGSNEKWPDLWKK